MKLIPLWVKEEERDELLKLKEQVGLTWREFFLSLAAIPHEKIPMGRPKK